jgi:hypothetical protein
MITGKSWGVLADSGKGVVRDQASSKDVSYSGGYTAEWIVGYDKSNGKQVYIPLADYGTVAFSELVTSLSSWSLTQSEGEDLVDGQGIALSIPSLPTAVGFSVSYAGPVAASRPPTRSTTTTSSPP